MFIHIYYWPTKATVRMNYWMQICEDNYAIMKGEIERLE
jgi:hypothetical protein